MRSKGGCRVTSSPKNKTRPAVAGKSPVITLNNVVLPAPFAPMTARRSPAATENETFSIARRAPKARVTPSRTRASPEPVPGGLWGEVTPPFPLGAVRFIPRTDLELRRRSSQRLVDVVDPAQHLVVQVALLVLHHLGDERAADRLTVRVELVLAGGKLQRHLRHRLAVLLVAVGQVALHRLERVEGRLHVGVVHHREE